MAIDQSALADPVVRLLARRTKYVEPEILGLRSLVAPGNVCVDVGAAAGLYTLALSRLVGPTGEVHSIEPLTFAHPVWSRVLGTRSSRERPPALTGAGQGAGQRCHERSVGPVRESNWPVLPGLESQRTRLERRVRSAQRGWK